MLSSKPLAPANSIVELNNVGIAYFKQWSLQDFSVSLFPGTITVLLGNNGTGKSSLLKVIAGLKRNNSGIVYRKKGLMTAYAAQDVPFNADLPITIDDFFSLSGVQGTKLNKLLALFQIEKFAKSFLSDLSGGQLQKIKLIRTLGLNADLYIFDEPFSFLDLESQKNFWDELIFLKQSGKTVLLTTHDKTFIDKNVDQTLDLRIQDEGVFRA